MDPDRHFASKAFSASNRLFSSADQRVKNSKSGALDESDFFPSDFKSQFQQDFFKTKLPSKDFNSLLNTKKNKDELKTFPDLKSDFFKESMKSPSTKFANRDLFPESGPSRREFFTDMPSEISFVHSNSSQYSNQKLTKTVCSRVVKKRITRRIVNGEIVEEEEEIDEIENEPTTEEYVSENITNSCKNELKINNKSFPINRLSKLSLGNTESKDVEKPKFKAIEAPQKKGSKILNMLSFSKKKNYEKLRPIIEELKNTEEMYVKDLNKVVEEYMPELQRPDAPKELTRNGNHLLFGNIEIICMFHDVQFLTDLKESENTPDDIANCFLKHRKEFSLYRHYNRNQPNCEIYFQKYGSFFKSKQEKLNDPLDLRSYLIKPTQRLARYILLMHELTKGCKAIKVSSTNVDEALDMLKAEIRLGNDLMALDAIKECTHDLKDQGDLIYRDKFSVTKGHEHAYDAMVFLFEKIMLFTKIKLENHLDVLYYQDFIFLKDIGLTECGNEEKKFKVWFHKHTLKPYTLETIDKTVKEKWVKEIRKQLENELEKTKKAQGGKARTFINLKRNESAS